MPDPPGHRVTVWIVEDDAFVRESVQLILDATPDLSCPRAFDRCEDMLAALEHEFAPEVMLMDISLPGMSGIAGMQQVRAVSPSTHIVMLTVHEDNQKIFEAICAGASGYLLKPSTPERIVEAVRSARRGGAPINPQIARKVLHLFTEHVAPAHEEYGLTKREREILQLLVDGITKRAMAERLFVSFHTIDMHLRNIYTKLQVHSRNEATTKALRERLL